MSDKKRSRLAKADWTPNNPKEDQWEDVGEAVEVEQDYGVEKVDQTVQQKVI